MGRRPRFDEPHGCYHITQRGNDGLPLFETDDDRAFFLSFLGRTCAREKWSCFAYCLLTTHYHLVLRIGTERLGRGMNWLSGMYARVYNDRRARRGHVFGERYRVALIRDEEHLAQTCHYVDLNPVRAGICERPEGWPWSSYRARAGLDACPPFLQRSEA